MGVDCSAMSEVQRHLGYGLRQECSDTRYDEMSQYKFMRNYFLLIPFKVPHNFFGLVKFS